MSTSIAPVLTLGDAVRMIEAAIRDKTYQRETRLGSSVADYLAWKRFRASERTLVIYEGYLARLCIDLAHIDPDVSDVTEQMLLDVLGHYERGSWRLVRTTYSDFFRWASLRDLCRKNPVDFLPKIPEPPMRVYDVFNVTEQAKLIKATDRMPLPWVQRLRVLCLIDLGVRKEEARLLTPSCFDPVSKVAVVTGKGGKERVVPFGDELWRAFVQFRNRPVPKVRMHDEKGAYREARLPLDDDFVFFPIGVTKTGSVTWTDPSKPLAKRSMHTWWERCFESAGVRYRSMHMNRHTLGTDLADAEADSFTIREWLGHANVATTQVYVHNSRGRLQRGRGKLDEYRQGRGGA